MQVIATAGHVDHGKSTLVRALTGMEPDRWAEERRRGMTIDLGYAWTALPSGEEIAFVDVPGHERFTTNMLAGAGPVPAVLLVIAADEGWAAQTGEHVRALDALGVRHGVVAVTRIDLADPSAAIAQAQEGLARTSLAGIPAVGVSGQTGAGLDRLRIALDDLVRGLPAADPEARVRLWVDRSFTVRGSGTVVTGTLSAGTLRRGDVLELGNSTVTVRALQRLGQPAEVVIAPARVAVNLRAISAGDVRRGDALLTPGAWLRTAVVDARVDGRDWPAHGVLHVGAAAVPARIRRLDTGGSPGTSWDASSPSSELLRGTAHPRRFATAAGWRPSAAPGSGPPPGGRRGNHPRPAPAAAPPPRCGSGSRRGAARRSRDARGRRRAGAARRGESSAPAADRGSGGRSSSARRGRGRVLARHHGALGGVAAEPSRRNRASAGSHPRCGCDPRRSRASPQVGRPDAVVSPGARVSGAGGRRGPRPQAGERAIIAAGHRAGDLSSRRGTQRRAVRCTRTAGACRPGARSSGTRGGGRCAVDPPPPRGHRPTAISAHARCRAPPRTGAAIHTVRGAPGAGDDPPRRRTTPRAP